MTQKSGAVQPNISDQGNAIHYGDFQTEIYAAGLRGITPSFPISAQALEKQAAAAMPPQVLSYVQGGCGDESTQQQNVEAFTHWGLIPRMMVDCTRRDMSIDLFGIKLPSPIFMCPIGVIGMCAQDGRGDIHTARAAQITKIPMVASTLSNDPLEVVADAIGDGHGFFQLYTPTDRTLAESLVHRADQAGVQGDRRHARHLDHWLEAAGSQHLELPSTARTRIVQLFFGLQLPHAACNVAGRGPCCGHHAVGQHFRKELGMVRPTVATFFDEATFNPERDLSPR